MCETLDAGDNNMKLKMKIASTILSMSLALGIMGFAVYAAATQTLFVTNTIDFVSVHVLATVTGTVTGAMEGSYTNYAATTTLAGEEDGKLGTWAIGDTMEFDDETENIEITISILNNSIERSLSFEIGNQVQSVLNGVDIDDTNINRTVFYSINNTVPILDETYAGGAVEVEVGATAVIVIVLQITNTEKSVTAFNNAFTLTLRNVD